MGTHTAQGGAWTASVASGLGRTESVTREEPHRDPDCIFCSEETRSRAVAENETTFALEDRSPVTEGHVLVLPKRHVEDVFDMTEGEVRDAFELLLLLRARILERDSTVLGFNVGANSGRVAGQSVMHAHIHLIPRRKGDVDRPRGGVRGVVPGKREY